MKAEPVVKLVLGFPLLLQAVHGAVVTLYQVSPPQSANSATVSLEVAGTNRALSAVGPGDSGMTQYAAENVISLLVVHDPHTTFTAVSEPTTTTYTFEQGASMEYRSNSLAPQTLSPTGPNFIFAGVVQNCTLDISKLSGTCVEEQTVPQLVPAKVADPTATTPSVSTQTVTLTTTYSGRLVPFATITTSGGLTSARGLDLVFSAGVVGMLSFIVSNSLGI